MIYAKFDATGLPVGFWDEACCPPDAIPVDTIEITAEQHLEFLDNQGRRKWQDGSVVEALPPPPTPEEQRKFDFPNLEPDQFWFVVRASGYEPDLLDWIASMNDPASANYNPVDWAAASSKLQFAKFFERDHAFVEAARVAIGMSEAELDALWSFATQ